MKTPYLLTTILHVISDSIWNKARPLVFAIAFLFSSCATIISTYEQEVHFTTDPEKATVYINGIESGQTPLFHSLKRKGHYHIKLVLEGYKPFETNLNREFNNIALFNILLGGVVGIVVDFATGAIYKLTPKQLNIYLKENKIAYQQNSENQLFVHVALTVDKNMAKKATLLSRLEPNTTVK